MVKFQNKLWNITTWVETFRKYGKLNYNPSSKAARVAGYLNELVWRNIYMRKETKSKLYKETALPIITYALETKAEKRQISVGSK